MDSDKTPHPDAGSSESGNSDQSTIVVDDPEDFASTRQLRTIFDARDDYIDQRREANEAVENGDIHWTRANRHIFRYVQDFAMTVEPLLKSSESGKKLWRDQEFSTEGTFVAKEELATTADAKQFLKKRARDNIGPSVSKSDIRMIIPPGVDVPDGIIARLADEFGAQTPTEPVRVDGGTLDIENVQKLASGDPLETDLNKLTAAMQQKQQARQPDPNVDYNRLIEGLFELIEGKRQNTKQELKQSLRIAVTDWGWTAEGVREIVRGRCKLAYPTDNRDFGATSPPETLSNEVFRALNDYIDELGLGVQFGEEQQTKIDDETLREVDQWRQTNIN